MTVLAMGGKMPPRPSSPFSRSVMNATALPIARRRGAAGQVGLDEPQQPIDAQEKTAPGGAGRVGDVVALGLGRRHEQLVDPDAARVPRAWLERHQQRQDHDGDARPVRHLVEMEREPARQQHQLDRHHRHGAPGHLAEQGEMDPREHIGARRTASSQDALARPPHVRCRRIVADQLEREVRPDAGAEVEIATEEQRPAAMLGLAGAQIDGDLVLERLVDLVEEMLEEHVVGGNRGIGLELEHPVAIRPLQRLQTAPRILDRGRIAPSSHRRQHANAAGSIRSALTSDLEAFYHHLWSTARYVTDFLPEHKLGVEAHRSAAARSRREGGGNASAATRPFHRPPLPRRCCNAESTVMAV